MLRVFVYTWSARDLHDHLAATQEGVSYELARTQGNLRISHIGDRAVRTETDCGAVRPQWISSFLGRVGIKRTESRSIGIRREDPAFFRDENGLLSQQDAVVSGESLEMRRPKFPPLCVLAS